MKLERLIAASNNLDNIRFLRSLHDWLARHLVLSTAQLDAAGIVMHPPRSGRLGRLGVRRGSVFWGGAGVALANQVLAGNNPHGHVCQLDYSPFKLPDGTMNVG